MRALLLLSALAAAAALPDRYHPDTSPGLQQSRASPAESTAAHWAAEALAGIERRERARRRAGKARNVVMFLGDGMSVPTLAAARTLLGQRNKQTGEEAQLAFEAFPTSGFSKTYCLNAQVADSACSATAYLCGVKANSGTIGVTGAVPRHDCTASTRAGAHAESIAAWALKDGRSAGVVTTTRITHASPAGAYARVANRHWESDADVTGAGHDPAVCPDIAHQLVNEFPGNQLKVILGGGRRAFLPVTTIDNEKVPGVRKDNRNLIKEWENNKESKSPKVSHKYIWNRDQLMELMSSPPEYLLGLFESGHLQYHLLRNETTEPTLAELTEVAIRSLKRDEKGFFLFVESGRIDHGHHENLAQLALDETIAMSEAVAKATELLSEEDSLIVVTADHAHVMSFNGYSPRGTDILGPSNDRDEDGVPYMTLSYTNGPAARRQVDGIRQNVMEENNYGQVKWATHAEVPLESETHGGDDVGVFAWGPHHDMFSGVYEQSQIPHLMAYAGCFGPGKHACSADAPEPDAPVPDAATDLPVPAVVVLLLAVFQIIHYY